ncbi:Tetratricopeptide TPR_2 repeat protein [Methanocorpusculum labreanum Z]|uniref:Tetratricopeptide TPR_2 repeat protein n=1 Tax=Methanocorpusculum labreanum (strain ATCC 43576 / DSM 4855 / Z) TaxID=410358 RepID=A2SQT4_METLZ|nr:tetratricopeptide repeat protein [Methanocorpusculum labreanum]ABN06690.1 Tetratricopeptide TPR_2 repeat protein [Methanocorpusculum labreanum Z]
MNTDKELFRKGLVLFAARDFSGAAGCFTDALLENPENVNYYYYRGVCYQETGAAGEAISDYTSALSRSPSAYPIRYNRADLFLQAGDLEKARKDFEEILSDAGKDDPHWSALAYLGRGLIRLEEGEIEEAIIDLTAAEDLARLDGDKLLLARIGDELEKSGF